MEIKANNYNKLKNQEDKVNLVLRWLLIKYKGEDISSCIGKRNLVKGLFTQ